MKPFQLKPFQSELKDLNRMVKEYGPDKYGRCPGNRLFMPGKACIHCGSPDPRADCRSPGPSREEKAADMIRNS